MLFFFFFQAEDGIRDLVRSRGLGDVYKRQFLFREVVTKKVFQIVSQHNDTIAKHDHFFHIPLCKWRRLSKPSKEITSTEVKEHFSAKNFGDEDIEPVSYTHLTLPTIYSV